MFRATLEEQDGQVVLKLEGSLTGVFVGEVEGVWNQLQEHRSKDKPLVIDLAALTFANAAGKALLVRMYQSGAQLMGRGPLTRGLVESIVETASSAGH